LKLIEGGHIRPKLCQVFRCVRELKFGGAALREPGSHLPGGRIFFLIRDERDGSFFDQGEKMARSKGKPK